MNGPTGTPRTRARRVVPLARLGLATALCWAPHPLWELLPRDPATGTRPVPQELPWAATGLLLCALTVVAVRRGRSVPPVLAVVPLASGATFAAVVALSPAAARDAQGGLGFVLAIVLTLVLLPLVGTVAAFTMLAVEAAGRRRDPDAGPDPQLSDSVPDSGRPSAK